MLSEISQRKANTVGFHLYVESKIQNKRKNIRKQNRLVDIENKQEVTRGERSWGMKQVKEIKRQKLSVIKKEKRVTGIKGTVWGIQSIRLSLYSQLEYLCMMTDGSQMYCGNSFVTYRNIKSLCCTPGIKTVLQVNYTSKTNSQKKRSDL